MIFLKERLELIEIDFIRVDGMRAISPFEAQVIQKGIYQN